MFSRLFTLAFYASVLMYYFPQYIPLDLQLINNFQHVMEIIMWVFVILSMLFFSDAFMFAVFEDKTTKELNNFINGFLYKIWRTITELLGLITLIAACFFVDKSIIVMMMLSFLTTQVYKQQCKKELLRRRV